MVAAAAAIGCAMLLVGTFQPCPVAADEVSEDAAEEFWDTFMKQTYPGSTKSFTPLEKSLLAQFSNDRRQREVLKKSGIAAGVGGALSGILTPLLLLKAQQKADASAEAAPPLTKQEPELPAKGGAKRGVFGRMKDYVAWKDGNTARKVGWGLGATGLTLALAMTGLLVASHLKDKKIKRDRRKFRSVMLGQKKDSEEKASPAEEGDNPLLGQPTVEDIMKAIEEAQNPTGPLNKPPKFP